MKKKKDNKESGSFVINDLSSLSLAFVSIFVLCFFGAIIMPLLVINYFYFFILGAIVNGFLIVDYKISKYIVISFSKKDYTPLKWFVYVFVFIIFAIVIGYFLSGQEFVSNIYDTIIGAMK